MIIAKMIWEICNTKRIW